MVDLCDSPEKATLSLPVSNSAHPIDSSEPFRLDQFTLRSLWIEYMLENNDLDMPPTSSCPIIDIKDNSSPEIINLIEPPKLTRNNSSINLSATDGVVSLIETFSPRSSRDICGNKKQIRQFKKWLGEWIKIDEARKRRQIARELKRKQETLNGPGNKKPKKGAGRPAKKSVNSNGLLLKAKTPISKSAKSYIRDDDEESSWDGDEDISDDFNSEEDNEVAVLARVFVIQGPTGCGKTSVVYACAQEMGFDVKEENTINIRSGSQIKKRVHETSQSKGMISSNSTGSINGSGSIFGGVNSVDETPARRSSSPVPVYVHGMKLILFDEADLTFDDEVGMYRAIMDLAKESKCPIVMTVQSDIVFGDRGGRTTFSFMWT